MSTNTPITADYDGTNNIMRIESLIAKEQEKKSMLEDQLASSSELSPVVISVLESRIAKKAELIASYELQLAETIVDALEGGEE